MRALRLALTALMLAGATATANDAAAAATPAWLPAVPLSAPSSVPSEGADVASSAAGDAIAVWVRAGGEATVVEAAVRPAGGVWSAARVLSTAGRGARSPQVVMNERGDAVVVWAEDSLDGVVIRHRARPAGGDFSASVPLSDAESGRDPGAPQAAIGPDGAATVAWTRAGQPAAVIQAVTRDSASERFGLPVQISPAATAAPASEVHVAMTRGGETVAVWLQSGSTIAVRAATRPSGGAWTPSEALYVASDSLTPDLAVNGSGQAVVVWRTQGPEQIWKSLRSDGTWSSPGVVTGGTLLSTPQAGLDDNGTLSVVYATLHGVWELYGLDGAAPFTLAEVQFRNSAPYDIVRGPTGASIVYWTAGGTIYTRLRPPGGPFGTPVPVAGGELAGRRNVALDGEGNAVAVWQQRDAAGNYRVEASGLDGGPPRITALDVPATARPGVPIDVSAEATDRWSDITLSWHFSDGTEAAGARVSHAFAAPGTAQVVVTARDAVGNETSASRPVEVVADPPVARVDPDGDGDGVAASRDCDDANAAIRPTTREVPGNAADENCDGLAEPYPRVLATAQLTSKPARKHSTQLLRLTVADLSAGDSVRVRCTGHGCRKAMSRVVAIRSAPKKPLDLTRSVKGVRLRPKARLEIAITHPERVARIFAYVMRASGTGSPKRTRQCQAPGQKRPVPC